MAPIRSNTAIVKQMSLNLAVEKLSSGPGRNGLVSFAVERTAERRIFLVPVENRKKETYQSILSRHVYSNSRVFTDM